MAIWCQEKMSPSAIEEVVAFAETAPESAVDTVGWVEPTIPGEIGGTGEKVSPRRCCSKWDDRPRGGHVAGTRQVGRIGNTCHGGLANSRLQGTEMSFCGTRIA